MNKKNSKKGFTLVELAIVVVVISLLIVGGIKGQEVIANAKLNAVITQAQSFKSAFASFQDKYSALPGDFAAAQTQIPGCGDAGGACANGNGNGELNASNTISTAATPNEGRMAWQHLAFANLLTGIVPGTPADNTEFGKGFPAARIGGGYILLNTTLGEGGNRMAGLWARLQRVGPTSIVSTNLGEGVLTPGEAAIIDRRMDDGNALTGAVRSGGYAQTCTREDGTYDESISSRDCVLYFYML